MIMSGIQDIANKAWNQLYQHDYMEGRLQSSPSHVATTLTFKQKDLFLHTFCNLLYLGPTGGTVSDPD